MPTPPRFAFAALLAAFAGLFLPSCREKSPSSTEPRAPAPISFNFEIRPLLAKKCFGCHGPYELQNESGLRLDAPEFAFHPLGDDENTDRHAFFPGDRERSVAWHRVHSENPEEQMPPPGEGEPLTPPERELLGRWIDQGARYETHWAFQPLPRTVAPPKVSDDRWPKHELDRFVLASLERAQIRPAPETNPATWLRRVSLALSGLPPTVQQLNDFLAAAATDPDNREQVYATAVAGLLDSPHFGERLAELWLETTRYADNVAPQSVDFSTATRWLYRDWVIRSFNDNLPFDQFVTAQLAGDLDDSGHHLATAFNRLHPLGTDPRTHPEIARRNNAAQRVRNLGTAVLGLSLHCAQCHDHKADPFSQDGFEALAGFFRTIPESGLYRPGVVPAPTLALPTREESEQLLALQKEADAARARYQAARQDGDDAFQKWLAQPLKVPVINDAVGIFSFDDRNAKVPNRSLSGSGDGDARNLSFTKGFSQGAVRFDGEAGVTFRNLFPLRRTSPWSFTLRLRDTERSIQPAVLLSRGRGPLDSFQGLDLILENGHLVARLAREWPANAIGIRSVDRVVPPIRWTLVTWTYDGSSSADGMNLFVDGKPVPTEVLADSLWNLPFPRNEAPPPVELGWRHGAPGFSGGAIDDFQVHSRALTPLEVAHLYDGRTLPIALADPQQNLPALRQFFFSSLHEPSRTLARELTAARQASIEPESEVLEISIMKEGATAGGPPPVAPQIPAFLEAPSSESRSNEETRLGLALTITHPDHPLPARVCVNRLWANFFGRGLVESTDDFGQLGSSPTHHALLDWMARDFVDHRWNVKRLCRQIALSATFRQDSAPRPNLPAGDARALLAVGPSLDLSPGQLRDLVLHASEQLDLTVGGPSVQPGERPFRRSLYSLRRHPAPHPPRDPGTVQNPGQKACAFDYHQPLAIPSGPVLSPDQHRAASTQLAGLLLLATGDDSSRLQALARRLAGRPPTQEETTRLSALLAEERARPSPDAPQERDPDDPADPQSRDLDPHELAAWTAVVQAAPQILQVSVQP